MHFYVLLFAASSKRCGSMDAPDALSFFSKVLYETKYIHLWQEKVIKINAVYLLFNINQNFNYYATNFPSYTKLRSLRRNFLVDIMAANMNKRELSKAPCILFIVLRAFCFNLCANIQSTRAQREFLKVYFPNKRIVSGQMWWFLNGTQKV